MSRFPDFDADSALMHRLADAASAAILPHFRARTAVTSKGGARFDPVTAADRGAEQAMRALLAEERPADGIVGEEFAAVNAGSPRVWVLDPIDGTRAFMTGLPTWGVLIGLRVDGAFRLGLMVQPYVGERFWTDGTAAWWRRGDSVRRLAARACPALGDADLLCTTPAMFEGEARTRFETLAARVRSVRFGTDCYGYAMVAAGEADLVVEAALKIYDVAPFVPMLRAVGGGMTTWTGAPVTDGGAVVAAGDPALGAAAVRILSGEDA